MPNSNILQGAALSTLLAALLTLPAAAQNLFTDADGADSDWGTAGNWSIAEPTGGDDAFVIDSLNADITQAGEAVRVLYVGNALDTAVIGNDGNVTMTGGDLAVGSLRIAGDSDGNGGVISTTVTGVFDFIDGAITANNAGVLSEAVQIGSTNFAAGTLTSIDGTLTMGDGTSSPTLDYSAGRFEVGTGNGATATFNFNSGTVTGANQNLIIGQGDNASVSNMTMGGGATAATFDTGNADTNFNAGAGTLTINSNATLTTRTVNLAGQNAADNLSSTVLTVNTGGTLNISGNLNDRIGDSTVNLNGGQVAFSSATGGARGVETLNLGGGGTGSGLGLVVGTAPLTGTTAGSIGAGNHAIDVLGTANTESGATAGLFDGNVEDSWVGGTGSWDTDGGWSLGIDPSGVVNIGDSVNVVRFDVGVTPDAGATYSVTDGGLPTTDWTAQYNTGTNAIELEANVAQDFGVLRAVIGSGDVTRGSGDLQVYRGAGAAAQALTVNGGSLTVTAGNDLIIGGAPITVNNNASTVTQNGGTVTLESNLRFGTAAGDEGGVYNLTGGTLVVQGAVIETANNVDNAQLYIDGGTLDFQGTNITVQSFRTGNAAGSTGDFTLLAGQTLTTSGTLTVGNAGTGTLTAEAGSTIVAGIASGTPFTVGDSAGGNGTFISNGADITSSGVVRLADRGTGTTVLNNGTTWTNTGGNFIVAEGDNIGADNASGTSFGATGTLTMNGDATIIQSGGNFETAALFAGARTVDSLPDGTVTMNDDSRIIVGSNNFILGQSPDSKANLVMSGNSLLDLTTTDGVTPRTAEGDFRVNSGDGSLTMSGTSTIKARDLALSSNVAGSSSLDIGGFATIDLSRNVDFGANGNDSLALSGSATLRVDGNFTINNPTENGPGVAPFNELTVSGSDVTFIVGDDGAGNFIADADARITFIADAGGVSPIIVNGSIGRNGLPLIFDLNALLSATMSNGGVGDMTLFDVGTTQNGGVFSDGSGGLLNEGDTVWTFADGSAYTITYGTATGGDDVRLLSIPEPASALLAALAALLGLGRRRRSA